MDSRIRTFLVSCFRRSIHLARWQSSAFHAACGGPRRVCGRRIEATRGVDSEAFRATVVKHMRRARDQVAQGRVRSRFWLGRMTVVRPDGRERHSDLLLRLAKPGLTPSTTEDGQIRKLAGMCGEYLRHRFSRFVPSASTGVGNGLWGQASDQTSSPCIVASPGDRPIGSAYTAGARRGGRTKRCRPTIGQLANLCCTPSRTERGASA